ncbi:UNVERIFIED_CONTAM: hypothetical protein FKN15_076290 [Acipenser sinensis]
MNRNALAELLQALESRRDVEERRREERYTALIERTVKAHLRSCRHEKHYPEHHCTEHLHVCIHPRTGDRAFVFCSGLCFVIHAPRALHIAVYCRGFII